MITYRVEEIEKVIGAPGSSTPDADGTGSSQSGGKFNVPDEVKQGDRHGVLFNLLRSQKARGISMNAALACCHAENTERCDPPIKFEILDAYLRRCWNQPDKHDYKGAGEHSIDFRVTDKGKIIPNDQDNVRRALEKLGVKLSFDTFSQKPHIVYEGHEGVLQDEVRNRLWLRIDEEFGFRPSGEFFDIVIQDLAASNKYHPVRQYLSSLTWDKRPRLDNWLITAANAADSPYTKAVGALVLIAAVRRVMRPGCKFDELMVLESTQGLQKSSALRMLCPEESWFSDDLPLNVDAKQIIERTLGKWIIEAAELSGMHRSQVENLKSMLSRQVDGPVRMAYGRLPVEQPRQCIFIGTTNSHTYLNDTTGNRRFWPVRVEKFDLNWIKENRDQLWAEAAYREAMGESIRLNPELYPMAEVQQERRRAGDPWEFILTNKWGEGDYHRVTPGEIWDLLGIPTERQNHLGASRISQIMQRLGFSRGPVRDKELQKIVKGWVKGKKLTDEGHP